MPVCGNTWMMLKNTRFAKNFEFYGDFKEHYGIYEGCGEGMPFKASSGNKADEAGCCWLKLISLVIFVLRLN